MRNGLYLRDGYVHVRPSECAPIQKNPGHVNWCLVVVEIEPCVGLQLTF